MRGTRTHFGRQDRHLIGNDASWPTHIAFFARRENLNGGCHQTGQSDTVAAHNQMSIENNGRFYWPDRREKHGFSRFLCGSLRRWLSCIECSGVPIAEKETMAKFDGTLLGFVRTVAFHFVLDISTATSNHVNRYMSLDSRRKELHARLRPTSFLK